MFTDQGRGFGNLVHRKALVDPEVHCRASTTWRCCFRRILPRLWPISHFMQNQG